MINLLYFISPFLVAGVRFALMQQYTANDTLLLSLFSQRHESFVGIVIVCLQCTFHPMRSTIVYIVLNGVADKSIDVNATDGHVDDTKAKIVRKVFTQGATEVVGRCQTSILAAQRWYGLVPLAHLTTTSFVVHGGHHQEAFVHALQVLWLNLGIAFHVGLSQTEKDVEVLIGTFLIFSPVLGRYGC